MIAKILTGTNVVGLLQYLTKKKHEVLTSNKILPVNDIEFITRELKQIQGFNSRAKKNTMHIVLAFDKGISIDGMKMKIIAEDFMKRFGAHNNQWISFKHFDTDHQHQHIVLNRVKEDGTILSDSYSHLTARNICRDLEKKYQLRQLSNIKRENTNISMESLKQLIDITIDKVSSLDDFKRELEKNQYKVLVGRGISFINKSNGVKIKGSAIGRQYSLGYIKKRLHNPEEVKQDEVPHTLKKESNEIRQLLLNQLFNNQRSVQDDYQENLNKKKRIKRKQRKL